MAPLPRLGEAGSGLPQLGSSANPYPLQNIIFDYPDNVDNLGGGHPLNLDYFIPVNCQQLVTARLSFKLRAYRTYSNFSASGTGTESANHNHSHNHGAHSHSHAHVLSITGGIGGTADMIWDTFAVKINKTSAGNTTDSATVQGDATGTTPTTDASGESASHTHPITGSTGLGIQEGAVATGVLISFDGVAGTGPLAGPFNSDQVDLDVTTSISGKIDNLWHVVSLQPASLGRITAILRLTYFSAVVQH